MPKLAWVLELQSPFCVRVYLDVAELGSELWRVSDEIWLKIKNRNVCLRLQCDISVLLSSYSVQTYAARGWKALSTVGQRSVI